MKSRIVQPAASFQPPDTCTEHEECKAGQATTGDLKRNALDHYERISAAAHEWYSVIPKAIAAYFDKRLEAENAATSMRSACVEKVEQLASERVKQSKPESEDHEYDLAVAFALFSAAEDLQLVPIQEQEKYDHERL